MKPVRRSVNCWLKLFNQHEKSGQSMKAFCKPLNINPKYFSLRRKKLGYKNNKLASKANAFIQLSPIKTQSISSNEILVTFRHTSGISIQFNTLPPLEYLQSLIVR